MGDKELSSSDVEFIDNEVLKPFTDPSESSLWQGWVEIAKGKKYHKNIVVVGNYRIFLIKKGLFGKLSLDKDIALLDLSEMREEGQTRDTIALVFHSSTTAASAVAAANGIVGASALSSPSPSTSSSTPTTTTASTLSPPSNEPSAVVVVKSSRIREIVKRIRQAHRHITQGVPKELSLRVNLPPELVEDIGSHQNTSTAGGFADTYLARCNYLKLPLKDNLVRFVSDLAAINYTDMNLAYCPGADYKSDAAIAFQPVLQSLAHNTYFRAVTARDIVFDEKAGDVAALGVAMRTNRTILKLIISNASITDITELGASLTLNKFHQLMVLDLSKNNLSNEKGVLALADALAVYPHALKVLNLERCSISPRGMQALFEAFGKNYGMSLSIQELYVGGNNFLDIGSAAFNKWLDTAKAYAGLRRVSLANCNALNTAVVVKHLIPVAPRLEWLDVSGCKINDDDMSTFQSLIFALKSHYRVPEAQVPTEEDEQIGVADPLVLKFSNCQLSINGLISLFSSLRQNTALRQVALDISQNDIGPNGMATLAKEIKAARCITSLNLADTKLKGMKGIQTLIDQGIPPFLTTLVLDENFSASEGGELTALLGRWLASNPQLLNLSLRGGRSSHLRRAVLPLLDFLKSNITLEYLDISYNYIGDQAAFAIAECLRENKKLKYLHLDRNQITISGWMTIYTALVTRNRTLVSVGSPVVDMEKALAQIPEVKRPELHSLFFQLRTLLARNLSSSLPPPSSSSSPDVVDGSMFEILSPRSVVASRFVQLHPLALFAPATDSEFVSPLRDGPSFFEHHVPLPSFLGGSASAPPPFTRDSRLSLALTASPIPSSSTVLLSPAPSTAHLNPEQTNSSTQATPKKEKHSRKTKAPKATPTPDVDQSDIPPVPAEPTASNDTILPSTPPPAPSAAPSEPSVGSVGTNSVPDESPPPPPPSYIPPPPNSGNSDSNGPSRPVSRVIRASEMPPPPPPPPNAPPPPPPR